MTPLPTAFDPGLRWLIHLRWLALVGQLLLFAAGVWLLGLRLPLGVLVPCLAVTAASNALVAWKHESLPERTACAALLALDTLTLTILLYWLGGAYNPFTAFYLLHIAMASVLLPALWAWIGVALCGIAYGLLFYSPHKLVSTVGLSCCDDAGHHLQGMLVAMILVGVCIAFFIGQLKSLLSRRESELARMRQMAARNEKFASMATLAAGVAHELATPLGTIAVLSADLARGACSQCGTVAPAEDARLIRSEVERCRSILEALGEEATQRIGESHQPITLTSLPERLREFLRPGFFSRLIFDLPKHPLTVWAPPAALLQSLAVLVKNACEADPSSQPVLLKIAVSKDGVTVTIQDHGAGMTPEVVERAGEPFFTTKEPGQGMGLGLFLVRMFAERMGGRVDIQSRPGVGTILALAFPAHCESP